MPTPARDAFRQSAAFAIGTINHMLTTLDTPSPFDELLLSLNREKLGIFSVMLTLYGLAIAEARDAGA